MTAVQVDTWVHDARAVPSHGTAAMGGSTNNTLGPHPGQQPPCAPTSSVSRAQCHRWPHPARIHQHQDCARVHGVSQQALHPAEPHARPVCIWDLAHTYTRCMGAHYLPHEPAFEARRHGDSATSPPPPTQTPTRLNDQRLQGHPCSHQPARLASMGSSTLLPDASTACPA
jgi:hypothetical protein